MLKTYPLIALSTTLVTKQLPAARWIQFRPRYSPVFAADATAAAANDFDGLNGFPIEVFPISRKTGQTYSSFRVYDRAPQLVDENFGFIFRLVQAPAWLWKTSGLFYFDVTLGEHLEDVPNFDPSQIRCGIPCERAPFEYTLGTANPVANGAQRILAPNPRRREAWVYNAGPNPIELFQGFHHLSDPPPVQPLTAGTTMPVMPGEKLIYTSPHEVWAGCAAGAQVAGAGTVVWEAFEADF